ncbi:hypothetical protein [Streptomyces sp. NPDC002067]
MKFFRRRRAPAEADGEWLRDYARHQLALRRRTPMHKPGTCVECDELRAQCAAHSAPLSDLMTTAAIHEAGPPTPYPTDPDETPTE